jgi:hypothetical protein
MDDVITVCPRDVLVGGLASKVWIALSYSASIGVLFTLCIHSIDHLYREKMPVPEATPPVWKHSVLLTWQVLNP